MCGVYEARQSDCRGYVCWNQEDETVYDYAVFLQEGVGKLRDRLSRLLGGTIRGRLAPEKDMRQFLS